MYPNLYDCGRLQIDARGRIWMGYQRGLAYSDDGGATWTIKQYPELTSDQFTHVTPLPDRSSIWVGTDNLGIFKSVDGGESIVHDGALDSLDPPYAQCTTANNQAGVQVSPYDPRHLVAVAGWSDGKLMRSGDGGATWSNFGVALGAVGLTGMAFQNDSSIAFEPGDLGTFWVQNYVRDCSGQGMAMTNDGARSFTNVPETMDLYSTIVGRSVDTEGNEILWQARNCGSVSRVRIDRF